MLSTSTCNPHAIAGLALAAALALAPGATLAAPPPPAGMDVNLDKAPVGVPQGSATMAMPWRLEFATPPAVAGGAPVINPVNITNLPAQMPGESIAAASKRKADTIAKEINKVLPMVNGMPAASVTQMVVPVITGFTPAKFNKKGMLIKPAMPIIKNVNQSFLTVNGLYSIPDTRGRPGSGTPAVKQLTNPTKEYGDGLRLIPGQPGSPPPSPGSTGSMGGTSMSSPASGFDSTGAQSIVYLGVEDSSGGIDLAGVMPTTGETDFAVLQDLGTQLNHFGIQTSLSSLTDTLDITSEIPLGDTMVFGNTDTNLDFSISQTVAVPEPAAWSLMLVGFGALGASLRGRPERRRPAGPCWNS